MVLSIGSIDLLALLVTRESRGVQALDGSRITGFVLINYEGCSLSNTMTSLVVFWEVG